MVAALLFSAPAAPQVKTLIMPGPVIEGHAEFEADCEACHAAFDRTRQRALCLDCHEAVAADLDSETGFHGRTREIHDATCASCHTDHEGRDADVVGLDVRTFDHGATDFRLLGKHADAACGDCHLPDSRYREAPQDCIACHEPENPHEPSLGTGCDACHSPSGWPDIHFDHETTEYPLIGKHQDAECRDCHAEETFELASTTCYSCHAGDDAHEGRSGNECANCHNPTSWTDTSFNHDRDTDFPLDGMHAEQSCDGCHSEGPFADALDTACVSCHIEDDHHEGHFGAECSLCHISDAWDSSVFDHNRDTEHELHGAHTSIECVECHVEPVFDVALESSCYACHEKDDPHAGTQGRQCEDCHSDSAWPEDVFFDHGLTGFPLLGKHSEATCDDCHETRVFEDAPTDCVDCHRDDDAHEGRFATDCAQCHTPVDWINWRFDHDAQTEFPLLGAHTDVTCEGCHRRTLAQQTSLGDRCIDCHRSDDIHNGEFGYDCGRCHSVDSFLEVRTVQ